MLYTLTPPTMQGERIDLYPTVRAAQAHAEDGRCVHAVAVAFDGMGRCLIPEWKHAEGVDPTWVAPAEVRSDGSITTQGPIPERLFVH